MAATIPTVTVNSGHPMPTIGLGTASNPPATPEAFRSAMLDAISLGYRHFDTAAVYRTEQLIGKAVTEAVEKGLIESREELFITTKSTDTHHDRIVLALQQSLRNLQLNYVDLYLIHWPLSLKPEEIKSVWEAFEECQRLGLVKSIGVSNFSCIKLKQLLSHARIMPSTNQVEMHPVWQQKKMIDFCKGEGIHVVAYSPLGSNGTPWGTSQVMENDVLKEIALARGKSIAQVSLRWIHEQGVSLIVKSFTKERMKQNSEIFDWELSKEELNKISQIPQRKIFRGEAWCRCFRYFQVTG